MSNPKRKSSGTLAPLMPYPPCKKSAQSRWPKLKSEIRDIPTGLDLRRIIRKSLR